jgi:hypothetical protein
MPNRQSAPTTPAWVTSSSRRDPLSRRPRASKVLPILTRRDAYYPLKYAAHRAHIAEPALLGNPLETVTGFLQAPASSLHTQTLNEFARCDALAGCVRSRPKRGGDNQ